LEHFLDDSLEMLRLFGVGQLVKQVCFGVSLPWYVIHIEAFKVVNKIFGSAVVLEQYYFFGLISVGNLPLDKQRVTVAS